MLIDCGHCRMRDIACGDCMVTALLGSAPAHGIELGDGERRALGALADIGMVPPLRLVPDESRGEPRSGRSSAA